MFLLPVIAIVSVAVCILTHYEALRFLSATAWKLPVVPRQRILFVVLGAFTSHAVHVMIFALALWVSIRFIPLDAFGVRTTPNAIEALYVSIESYASLGTASEFPHGPLRLFAGIEALAGLVLAGWTSAFTYWCMTQFWNDH